MLCIFLSRGHVTYLFKRGSLCEDITTQMPLNIRKLNTILPHRLPCMVEDGMMVLAVENIEVDDMMEDYDENHDYGQVHWLQCISVFQNYPQSSFLCLQMIQTFLTCPCLLFCCHHIQCSY